MFLIGSRLVQKFTNLLDTFSSYVGKSGYLLSVKSTEDGLEAIIPYSVGDWTAGFVCGTSGTITIDPNFKTGAYVKIGRMVTVTGFFRVDSVSSPTGILYLTGLPFACGSGYKFRSAVSVWATSLQSTAATMIMGYINFTESQITLQRFATGVGENMAADVQANSDFIIGTTYFTG